MKSVYLIILIQVNLMFAQVSPYYEYLSKNYSLGSLKAYNINSIINKKIEINCKAIMLSYLCFRIKAMLSCLYIWG